MRKSNEGILSARKMMEESLGIDRAFNPHSQQRPGHWATPGDHLAMPLSVSSSLWVIELIGQVIKASSRLWTQYFFLCLLDECFLSWVLAYFTCYPQDTGLGQCS